jgi:hypothetical protein
MITLEKFMYVSEITIMIIILVIVAIYLGIKLTEWFFREKR